MSNPQIEDMLPLSPMQKGMLFHNLYSPSDDTYFLQLHCLLEGAVDVEAFERAWQRAVDSNPILRTSFFWEELDEPIQVVSRHGVVMPIDVQDWSALAESEQDARLADYLTRDRLRGFDLTQAPLMRLALMRLGPTRHRLVWSYHHLLLDGWSITILLRDVFSFYEGLRRGVLVEPERRSPYRDFIAWLHRQPSDGAEQFWRERLRGFSVATPLGVSRPTPTKGQASESRGADEAVYGWQRAVLSAEQTRRLVETARREQLTLNALVQSAWALLLSRYSGERDVLFGATVAGRPADLPGVERMLGLFINTLPVRVRVDEEAEVGEWLRRVQAEGAEARQYEHSPLVEVAGWSEVARGAPLFESLIVFDNYPTDSTLQEMVENPDLPKIREVVSPKRTNYPLLLTVAPSNELRLLMSYECARFDDETVVRMLEHLVQLLTGIAERPVGRVAELSMLSGEERNRLLVEANRTAADFARELCLHQLFERQAALTPEAVAVTSKQERLTYRQLDERANQLAHHLRSLGVGPEVRVGVMLERSAELVVGVLGVLKAGGAYVPLDARYPAERLRFMVEDAQVSVLLTSEELLDNAPSVWAQVVTIDADRELIAAESAESPEAAATPENLCYFIYTSGSTGRPKGVMIEHRSVVNYLGWCAARYAPERGAGAPVHSPLAFDLTVTSLFAPLVSGACVELVGEEEGVEGLAEALRGSSGYGLVKLTPSHLEVLSRLVPADEAAGRAAAFVIGGEALTGAALEFWRRHAPETRLINEYGPTEATVGCCVYEVARGAALGEAVPIGRPISNSRAYVLDALLRPVPEGVGGELFVGGEGLARGYAYRPALTAERFLPDPFSTEPGARMYRTGDVARWRFDGELEYLGRNDEQVKVRGYRVELGEVEAVLAQHPAVAAAAAVARDDASGAKRLVGYVVAEPGGGLAVDGLRAFVQERLPEYMVPSAWVMLEALPLTPNGKVDRVRLPDPEQTRTTAAAYVALRSPVEEMLAEIWADVLKVESVGLNDNFFELGGHSLIATQVISRVRQAFQVETSLNDLFDAPTVAGLAAKVEDEIKAQHGLRTLPLVPKERPPFLPLSFAQQRLWFLDQFQPGSTAYNVRHTMRILGPLDVGAMRRSLTEVVRRHEVLRTTFTSIDGTPSQVVHEASAVELPVIDLSGADAEVREREAQRLAEQELGRPFDLSTGPLLRIALLRLSAEEHVALFTMHHIVSDAWSVGVLVRETAALYEAHARGGVGASLAELPVQYADFALWQREWLQGEVLEKHLSYWRTQLEDAPPVLELPTDRPRPRVQTERGAVARCHFSPELTRALKALGREEGVTLFMTLLAAFQAVLCRYSRQESVVVGTPVASRTRAEIEGLIGFFVNTLVLRTDLSGDPSFRELLARVREVCLGAYAHQDVPFEMLVEELQPERSMSYSPLFQVIFTLQNAPTAELSLKGLTVTPFGAETRTAKFDLDLTLRETEEGLVGGFEYNADLFDHETVERIIRHLGSLLEGAVANPARRVSELPLLTEEERHRLLVEWNETREEYQLQRSFNELFEEQVGRSGEAVALVFGEERLTYEELNRRANQLAHYLRSLGVGPEVRVGIMAERSARMWLAVLAVLKAGGVYVPIDPVYPRERVQYMLDNAGAAVLLTLKSMEREVEEAGGRGLKVVFIDDGGGELALRPGENPGVKVDADNLAYVIYTSGSTGLPKGAMVGQRGTVNHLFAMLEYLGMTGADAMAQTASQCSDISVWQFLAPLLVGGRVHVYADEVAHDPWRLLEHVERDEVAILEVVPSLMRAVLEDGAEEDEDRFRLTKLRWLLVTGEAVPSDLCRRWLERYPRIPLLNAYGPTECADDVTLHTIRQPPPSGEIWPPIGRPVANMQMYVLDRDLQPVPVGVAGELCVGGVGVGRGYLNNPQRTAEVFVPDPFSGTPGARIYRTGDLGRWLATGDIEFLGRVDHQVKVRGFRIELGEIESVLSAHASVRECVVVTREDASGDKRLVAYVVAEPEHAPDAAELRAHVRERLPDYMTPSAFVLLPELPLTPNGKIDRRRLPAPEITRDASSTYVAARTAAERVVASIYAEVLGVERVGVTDDFFALGGHSLLATRVVARVGRVFQTGLELRRLFERPTVEGVVESLAERWGDAELVEEIAQTYIEIEELPEESVEAMLAQQDLESGEPSLLKKEL